MKNIECNLGTTTYRDEKPPVRNIRLTAEFDDETEALAFNIDLLQMIAIFQVEVKNSKDKIK